MQTTGIAIWAPYAASRALNIRGRFVGGGTLYEKNVANFFDGTDKVCVFVATTTGLKIYINGNLVDTLAWTASDFASARAITIGGNANEQTISRVKVFNFDMSVADAPYTMADYTAGADEPPALKGVAFHDAFGSSSTVVDAMAVMTVPLGQIGKKSSQSATFSDATTIVSTNSESNQIRLWFRPSKNLTGAGKIKCKWTSATTDDTAVLPQYSLQNRASIALKSGRADTTTEFEFDFTDGVGGLLFQTSAAAEAGKTLTISGLEIWCDGALLSLSDYVFDGEILDASGNGKHATVSGNVAGTNDTAVETLYQKIAARISNNS